MQRGIPVLAGRWEQQDLLWVASSAHLPLETWGGDGWGGWSGRRGGEEATPGWREATPQRQALSKQWVANFNGPLLKSIVPFEHHSLIGAWQAAAVNRKNANRERDLMSRVCWRTAATNTCAQKNNVEAGLRGRNPRVFLNMPRNT